MRWLIHVVPNTKFLYLTDPKILTGSRFFKSVTWPKPCPFRGNFSYPDIEYFRANFAFSDEDVQQWMCRAEEDDVTYELLRYATLVDFEAMAFHWGWRCTFNDYARQILDSFVEQARDIYGPQFIVYNVHALSGISFASRYGVCMVRSSTTAGVTYAVQLHSKQDVEIPLLQPAESLATFARKILSYSS